MPKNGKRKNNIKKNRDSDAVYCTVSDAPLQAVSEEELAFLSSLSAQELNALIEGHTEVKRGV